MELINAKIKRASQEEKINAEKEKKTKAQREDVITAINQSGPKCFMIKYPKYIPEIVQEELSAAEYTLSGIQNDWEIAW